MGRRSAQQQAVPEVAELPLAARRWPWAVGAALAGAVAGAVAAWLAGRLRGQDAPDAVEPSELRAVVDQGDGGSPTPAA